MASALGQLGPKAGWQFQKPAVGSSRRWGFGDAGAAGAWKKGNAKKMVRAP